MIENDLEIFAFMKSLTANRFDDIFNVSFGYVCACKLAKCQSNAPQPDSLMKY